MKKVIFSALAVSFVAFSAFTLPESNTTNSKEVTTASVSVASPATKSFTVNTAGSTLAWEAKKVTGQHNGTVKISKGTLQVDKNNKPVSGTFDIDMKSIAVLDIEDPGYNKKLVDHLKNEDFFDVNKFPVATFKSTDIIANGSAKAGEPTHTVRGNLTIKGITQMITFPATIKAEGKGMRATADIVIDRSKWDVKYGSTSFFEGLGDKAIYNDINLKLNMLTNPGA